MGKSYEHKICVLRFSTTMSEIFLILRRIQQDIIVNAGRPSRRVPRYSSRILIKLHFLGRFWKNTQITNSVKIIPVEAEMFGSDRQMDPQNEAYWCFFNILPTQLKMKRGTHK
jgi:hypothetical protein